MFKKFIIIPMIFNTIWLQSYNDILQFCLVCFNFFFVFDILSAPQHVVKVAYVSVLTGKTILFLCFSEPRVNVSYYGIGS